MVRDFDITLKLKKEEIEDIREKIKLENKTAVYAIFGCKHYGQGAVHKYSCGDCQYLYRKDIRWPGWYGCFVEDYIKQVEGQLKTS